MFVIDTGGPPRVAVGPVARAYEHHGPQARRLDDAAGAALPERDRHDPWAKRYTAPAAAPPAFGVEYYDGVAKVTAGGGIGALGAITIEPLDHHRVPNGPKVTRRLRAGELSIQVRTHKADAEVSGLHLQIGDFHDWLELSVVGGTASASYGGWKPPGADPDPETDPAADP